MKTPELIRLFFDYVDPACFLLEERLRHLGNMGGSPLVLEPFEIRPPPEPLMDPGEESWRRYWRRMTLEAETLDVDLAEPGLVPWTRKAHELAAHARERHCFRAVHQALFRAYLLDGIDIGRIDLLVAIGTRQGLDRMTLRSSLDVDRYREDVEERRSRALALGVTRVPTLLWRDERLEGYPSSDALEAFLATPERDLEP